MRSLSSRTFLSCRKSINAQTRAWDSTPLIAASCSNFDIATSIVAVVAAMVAGRTPSVESGVRP